MSRPRAFRTIRLYSPVLGIFSTPDAQHAVVLHDKTAGEDGSPGAFSLVPIGQNLPAKIVGHAGTSHGRRDHERSRDHRGARRPDEDLWGLPREDPGASVDRYPLASPPIAVGAVPIAKRAFVAQQHPEGRLTFIDLDTGVARTLTGFELSSRVVDGSKP